MLGARWSKARPPLHPALRSSPPRLQEPTPRTTTGRPGGDAWAGCREPSGVSSPEEPCEASGCRSEVGFKHPPCAETLQLGKT